MIVCAGGNENFSFAKSIGVGLIESSINLTELCMREIPEKLIFIGSCGIYDKGEIFGIYESSHVFNIEYSQISENFYTPALNEINFETNIENVSQETFYKINSSNYICQNSLAAKKLADFGLNFENMEAFAVFSVAKKFNIQAKCILCATNFCNENAHEDFLKNHKKAKEKLENYLKENNYI
ncbi:phosphorylase family protein [Campylobacter aviculae]|uniref:Purine-nucleoside phosphorylase n=1 Tax=Campylobacter aviculae TaxID=2510190 RepID=A0A4U7BQH1_9BACT|nr:purine-nucleoside phosphorylase [Campylobacter aviculae]TKX30914.1 purine-nucleoside phosphorylase [Campylobacter aviculae]